MRYRVNGYGLVSDAAAAQVIDEMAAQALQVQDDLHAGVISVSHEVERPGELTPLNPTTLGPWRKFRLTVAGSVQKFRRLRQITQNLEQLQGGHADTIQRALGQFQAESRIGLTGEMVKLVRLGATDDLAQVGGVLERPVMQK